MEVVRPVGVLRVKVEIRTYPKDDESFRSLVVASLRRFDRVRHLAAIPARLDGLLETEFPYARSRYQDPLASSSGMPVLYVFRDGALVRPTDAGEGDGRDVGRQLTEAPAQTPTSAYAAAAATDGSGTAA